MTNLTEKETAVITSLIYNAYGDEDGGVWSGSVNDSRKPSGIEGKELSGVIGSLCKKGLLSSEEYEPGQDVLWFTDKLKAHIAKNGGAAE